MYEKRSFFSSVFLIRKQFSQNPFLTLTAYSHLTIQFLKSTQLFYANAQHAMVEGETEKVKKEASSRTPHL